MDELEIFDDKEKLTLGVRLSKDYDDKIEVYMFNTYSGKGMNISIDDAVKLMDKLGSLIKELED